jgi:hypothetical protein
MRFLIALITLILIAIVVLRVLSFTVHFLFSPWLLPAVRRRPLDQVEV